MGKKVVPMGMSRGDVYLVDPDEIVIIGGRPYTGHAKDTEHGEEHPLWDVRLRQLRTLDEKMVRNVARFGVLQPVGVRKDGDSFFLVYGRHRVCWARAANKLLREEGAEPIRVPCTIKRIDDQTALGVMVAENEVRVANGVTERAHAAARMLANGYDEVGIAQAFGVSRTRVREFLALSEASPTIHKAIDAGKIAPSAAIELAKLPRAEQDSAIASLGDGASARDAKRVAVEAKRGRKESKADRGEAYGYPRPGVADLRKLYAHLCDDEASLKAFGRLDNANVLRWIIGDVSSRQVTGLNDILRSAGVIE